MIDLNISLYIVVAFLLLTLLVGVYFSRQKTTFREYAVGNKQFATATLVATVLATTYGGGGLMRNVESVYALGLFWIVLGFLNCFGSYIISRLALRMGPFMEHLSMAETIGSIYGTYARVITAFVGICGSIIAITAQIIVMSQAINICLGSIDPYVITVLSTLLLIFYSIFGGVRAVTYTDVLQFITFSIIIPLLCWFIFIKIGKPFLTIAAMLQSEAKFQFGNLFCFNKQLVNLVLLFLSFLVPYMGPGLMQRVYMSSSPMQAQKVFAYATFFKFIITFFILLIGVLVFASAPHLQKADIWGYIITCMPPIFKGFVAVALFAMAMSTADSSLNACSVMMSHDILQSLEKGKEMADARQLTIARRTTLVVGLLAMLLKFRCPDLLKLFYWSLNCDAPIIAAPFTLAIFGFRGTARTVLVGMVVGVLSILAWNQWVQPATGMNGSLVAMIANGLAMMAAHYLLKQPKSAGWVEPDNAFKQIQQERARRQAERREMIRNAWANKKESLSKLVPAHTTIVRVGIYLAITSLLAYFIAPIAGHGSWLTLQLFLAACFVGYPSTSGLSKKIKLIPTWFIGLCWLMALVLYLPLNLLGHWWYLVDPIFATSLSLTHFAVILSVLPLYLGIVVIAITLLLAIYPIFIGLSYPVLSSLCPLLMVSLFLFAIIICLKVQQGAYIRQVLYLKDQEKIRSSQQLKSSLYDAALVASSRAPAFKGHGFILKQVVRKVEESISFLDNNTPLFKEDFQSIINKLYDWVAYFNRREKAKDHAMLQPTKITLDKLMRKLEVALSQEVADPPRLLVEKISMPSGALCSDMVCDINQVVYLLAKAVLRVGRLEEGNNRPIVRIQLHPTALQFKQADPIDNSCPAFIDFQAIALVVSQVSTPAACLPKVKERYYEIDAMDPQGQKDAPPSIDLEQDTISSMVRAHYGHWTFSMDEEEPTILFVFPSDVSDIRDKMTVKLPIDCLTSEASVTPKEQADSMMALMKFHDHICKSLCEEDPIDIKTVSGLILLLREHFRFKRHASGQLFYARAVGISEIVVDWVFHSPKVVYASLLYELVRHTCLPLSYVKEHYNLGVYAFVSNVVKIDKRQDLDHPSLLYVQNRLEKAIKENHLQLSVLFIKLAERLYDLRHAAGYIHPTEVHHMAQETLTIDIQIANQYLGPEIGKLLEKAAKEALKLSKHTGKEKTTA